MDEKAAKEAAFDRALTMPQKPPTPNSRLEMVDPPPPTRRKPKQSSEHLEHQKAYEGQANIIFVQNASIFNREPPTPTPNKNPVLMPKVDLEKIYSQAQKNKDIEKSKMLTSSKLGFTFSDAQKLMEEFIWDFDGLVWHKKKKKMKNFHMVESIIQ